MDSITHTTMPRTCKGCPNLSECSIAQPGADIPPKFCPMMGMPINVISFATMRLQIPEDPKYWASTLKTYLVQHRQ